ncbi:hypothetical protein HN935_03890 [archaeon]|jgi:hypothetical protein|nr:hypothetical protein [archaeon]
MVKNKNIHAFWQALIVALLIFWSGILVGVFFEDSRIAEITSFYSDSETAISDFEMASNLVFNENLDCQRLNDESKIFADRIYEEAKKLEQYDNSNKITDRMLHLHKRYDLLRTMLWQKIIENKQRCNESVDTIVYLYKYLTIEIGEVSTQKTMSNYLTEIKEQNPDAILIPIATDTGILSLGIIQERYDITESPSIIINEQGKIRDLSELSNIQSLLN